MTNQIVARRDVRGEGELIGLSSDWRQKRSVDATYDNTNAARLTKRVLDNPRIAILVLPDLVDLEPLRLRRVKLVASGARALRHVGQERTNVMRPLDADKVS